MAVSEIGNGGYPKTYPKHTQNIPKTTIVIGKMMIQNWVWRYSILRQTHMPT